jgi:hypothetical protein
MQVVCAAAACDKQECASRWHTTQHLTGQRLAGQCIVVQCAVVESPFSRATVGLQTVLRPAELCSHTGKRTARRGRKPSLDGGTPAGQTGRSVPPVGDATACTACACCGGPPEGCARSNPTTDSRRKDCPSAPRLLAPSVLPQRNLHHLTHHQHSVHKLEPQAGEQWLHGLLGLHKARSNATQHPGAARLNRAAHTSDACKIEEVLQRSA